MQTLNAAQALGEDASVRRKIQSLNPATGEVLAEFEPATGAEVEAAVGKAQRSTARRGAA